MVKTVQRCWFLEEDQEGTVRHCNWRRIWGYADSMSRVHSILRNLKTSRPRWMDSFRNTKIGPVLDVKVCYHQERWRCGDHDRILVSWPDSFMGSHCEWNQWTRYRKRQKKFQSREAFNSDISTEGLVAKAEDTSQNSVVNLSVQLCPLLQMKWMDVDPQPFRSSLSWCVKINDHWSLRHDCINFFEKTMEQQDLMTLIEKFKVQKFAGTLQLTVDAWVNCFGKRRIMRRNIFQYCLNPCSYDKFRYFRANQGYSGENFVDPLLQDNTLLPGDFTEYINHIGNAFEMHSIIQRGLIPQGRSNSKNR